MANGQRAVNHVSLHGLKPHQIQGGGWQHFFGWRLGCGRRLVTLRLQPLRRGRRTWQANDWQQVVKVQHFRLHFSSQQRHGGCGVKLQIAA